ncbi:uncharacterized protein LOC106158235 [Lingula anatina]|uniref:Uncharacterized protein LOC106158235 n=1 Tax=Lingula anatina TaxID=7574 RepID=A0A1S3HUA2_LINAN|nr:uncharacterized protein LOC106158235 [Lingula anatina]|eukprot:XP_013389598.1 uncharacterized protein LOC106158235 [Lingula anatina]
MKTCCRCMNLKQGSIASAIWSIIIGTIALGLYGYLLSWIYIVHGDESVYVNEFYTYWSKIILMSLWILSSILLIIGVVKGIRGMFIPWMIMDGIFVFVEGFSLIQSFLAIAWTLSRLLPAVLFFLFLALLLIDLYALVCVSAYYRQLSPATGDTEMQPNNPEEDAI